MLWLREVDRRETNTIHVYMAVGCMYAAVGSTGEAGAGRYHCWSFSMKLWHTTAGRQHDESPLLTVQKTLHALFTRGYRHVRTR